MLVTVGAREYRPDEVLDAVATSSSECIYEGFRVNMRSQRYQVFQRGLTCVVCGMEGSVFLLQQETTQAQGSAHFNLYGRVDGGLVLMTKDHIVPRSRGGTNTLANYQTMCFPCNFAKGASMV